MMDERVALLTGAIHGWLQRDIEDPDGFTSYQAVEFTRDSDGNFASVLVVTAADGQQFAVEVTKR